MPAVNAEIAPAVERVFAARHISHKSLVGPRNAAGRHGLCMLVRPSPLGPVSTAIQNGGVGAEAGPDLTTVAGKQAVGACGPVEAHDRLAGRVEASLVTQ